MDESEMETLGLDSGSESEDRAGLRSYVRTNPSQFQIMLNFMEQHKELTKGPAASLPCLEKWEVLRQALDAASDSDAPSRPTARWRRVWSDLKNNTKRKLQKSRAAGQPLRLTHNEFRTLKIIGMIKTKQAAAPAPVTVVMPPQSQPAQEDFDHIELKDGIIRAVPLEELQPAEVEEEGEWPLDEPAPPSPPAAPPSPPAPAPARPATPPLTFPGVSPPRPDARGHTSARGFASHSCTAEQLAALFDFLEEHKDLASGKLRSARGRQKAKRLWNELKDHLNTFSGGSVKSVQQWQKVWTDRKYAVKKSAASIQAGAAGGELTWELRVLAIMGPGFGLPYSADATPDRTMDDEEESSDPLGTAEHEEMPGPLPVPRGPLPAPRGTLPLPKESLRPSRARRQSPQSRKPRTTSGAGWGRGRGCGCRRALDAVARALARGEARAAGERRRALRVRRQELRLQREWRRLAERGLQLLEKLVRQGGAGAGAGAGVGAEGWATVLVPRARPLVLHPDSDWQAA